MRYSFFDARSHARARNRGWRVDYVLVPRALLGKVRSADIDDKAVISDHVPISIELEV